MVPLLTSKRGLSMEAERDAPLNLKLVKSEPPEYEATYRISEQVSFQQLQDNPEVGVKLEPVNLEFDSSPQCGRVPTKDEHISTPRYDLMNTTDGNQPVKAEPQGDPGCQERRPSRPSVKRDRPFPMTLYARDVCPRSDAAMVKYEDTAIDVVFGHTKPIPKDGEDLSVEQAIARVPQQYSNIPSPETQLKLKQGTNNVPDVRNPEAANQNDISKHSSIDTPDLGLNMGPSSICWEYAARGVTGQPVNMAPMGKHGEQIHYIPLAAVDLLQMGDGCLLKKMKFGSTNPSATECSSIVCTTNPIGPGECSRSSRPREYKPPFPLSVFDHLTYAGNSIAGNSKTPGPGGKADTDSAQKDQNPSSLTACTPTSSSHPAAGGNTKHTKSLPEELIYLCSICDYRAAQKGSLVCHLRNHTGEKPYKCSYCDYSSVQKSNLNVHLRTHTGKPYKCSICNFEATTKEAVDRHTRTHTRDKPYICSLCGYKSAQQGDLVRHKRKHTGKKPFKCPMCDYRSTMKSGMNDHLKTHTGDKPHSCELCEYKSITKSNLIKHMRKHTGYKPYLCDLCGYKFERKCSLEKHMVKHTGECMTNVTTRGPTLSKESD